jgi:diacylglycerol kinase (ATP)
MKNQGFLRRLGFALHGLGAAWHREASFRTQVLVAAIYAAALAAVHPPLFWVALSVLAAGMVLAAELLNTALEALVDHLHPELHPAIRLAKDCAAAAVFLASVAAAVIGVLSLAVGLRFMACCGP